jgi:dynein heavy chain 2, cytosolic
MGPLLLFLLQLSSLEADLASRQAALRAAAGRPTGRFGPTASSGRVSSLLRGRNESFAVSEVSWAEAVRARVRTLASSATGLLSDLRAFKECVDTAKDLGDQLSKYQQDVLSSWIEGTEAALRAGTLSLDASGRVVDFDRDGNIVVRYSEGMVTLVRDVRQLGEKGFSVPPRIKAAAMEAEALYRFGVQLQKVASFYNTLGAEIIPQQKPMLLEPLLAFEKLVQESAGSSAAAGGQKPGAQGGVAAVTWSDPKRCADFVEGLQRAADRLAAQNRRLRGVHARLCEEVASLMSIDMVRERDSWRSKWASCKEFIISGVVKAGGYSLEQISKWLGHWDYQMYKVLEVGYRMGLESLNEQLQEIKVDLVFVATPAGAAGPGSPATAGVVFRPSMEEVRAGYYREMKRFIGLPLVFDGFLAAATGSNAISGHIYSPMPSRNASCLAQVYRKAEIMFARLAMLKDKMKSWVALGAVDADAFVEARVRSVAEFEANFQVLKARRREADRLPDFQKVDCVSVNLAPFKAGLDAVFQRVNDALLLALRRILIENMRSVEQYLEKGIEMMSVKPQSLADIAKAQKNWRELSEARGGMKALTTQSEDQRRLLAGMAAGVLDLSDVNSRLSKVLQQWDSFDGCLEAFTSMAEEQRGMLKGNVAGEVKEAQATIDRFVSRWQQLKPGSASGSNAIKTWSTEDVSNIFTSLEDWTRQLEEVKTTIKQVQESCESFGLAPPQFDTLTSVEADVNDTLSLWQVYKQYDQERKAIASQDWITFRGKLFDLQDFAGKWSEAMAARQAAARPVAGSGGGSAAASRAASGAAGGRDIVTARIIDETDGISKAFNALKFARGEPFREEHWTAMFKKLGLPSKTTRIDNLTVGMLLDVLGPLAANTSWLKDLHSRAQGEVTIREALQEVKAWCETAEFKLMEHVSVAANGRKTPLIREWKDLFTAIGDNQSLLASLKDSPYFKPFADTAAVHEVNLATVDECCQKLNAIQRRWVYLEPVFSRGALPSEQARFKRVDEDFRAVMGTIGADPRAASLADAVAFPNLKENLSNMLDQLERCQRALSDFLEERRAKFPRFYFLGDDDLLEILGQSQNPAVIQSHLKKLYQGVFRVEFADSVQQQGGQQQQPQKSIVSMCSSANEVVRLVEPVPVTEDVTVWLNRFTSEMVRTLATLLVECLRSSQQQKSGSADQWEEKVARFPSQISCLAEQIKFCAEAEAALSSGGGKALIDLRSRLEAQLAAYTSKDTSKDTLMTLKVKALVLDTIHHLDVVDQLLSKEVKEPGAWMWQKQLRFYLDDKTGKAIAKMVDATVDYTYEYQGNFPKLVHTPLTDKCYMVLTQALSQGLGGNPYGPAGTGKTESVKALGAAIGRQVLVFNCDEGIDYTSFGRIFTSSPWAASSWGWSSAAHGAALMSSTVSRRTSCLQSPPRFRPSRAQSGRRGAP